jgi:hypothetical protein
MRPMRRFNTVSSGEDDPLVDDEFAPTARAPH